MIRIEHSITSCLHISNTITKRDGIIYAEISADITTKDVAKASADLQKDVNTLEKPKTVDVSFGGVTEQINESFKQLGLAMLAAVAIVYFVLVITFGGGLAPFAILFSLPFTIIGALVALLIAGETISVSALIGALMLVVTNAIVLIDRVIQKEKEGLSTREALLEAAVTRVRPILMTAIATVGALIPLAIGAGRRFDFKRSWCYRYRWTYQLYITNTYHRTCCV
jgi:HAE1 family hydrophobic/amphiphilic exporter-1